MEADLITMIVMNNVTSKPDKVSFSKVTSGTPKYWALVKKISSLSVPERGRGNSLV